MDPSCEKTVKEYAHGHHGLIFGIQDVDVAAQLAAGANGTPLDPQVAARIRRKVDMHLLPLMCLIHLVQFVDKTTLAQAGVLGIFKDANLSRDQFNWLGTIFYVSYLVFEYPQNLALQRFPVGKWMSINIFIWSIALLSHAACSNFAGLFVVRLILGACEGSITAGLMLSTAMFYTREEQNKRIGYWYIASGLAFVVLSFISFGVAHTETNQFSPWKWLMVITGILTIMTAVLFWFRFPDSPANAHFLTEEERVLAVQRIKNNQTGIENKHWKREQFIEAITDPKTWLLAFFGAIAMIGSSVNIQLQIVVKQLGFSLFQTTLLACVDGVVLIVSVLSGVNLVPRLGRANVGVIYYMISIIGGILIQALPFQYKVGLLFGIWLNGFAVVPLVVTLGWINGIVGGHTKRTTVIAIFGVAYGIGSAVGPLMWKAEYAPRNRITWYIIMGSHVVAAMILVVLRILLARENKQRDREERDETYDDALVKKQMSDGSIVEFKVDKAFLDLTDKQNRDFRYVY